MPHIQGTAWELMLESANPARSDQPVIAAGGFYELIPRSTALLRQLAD